MCAARKRKCMVPDVMTGFDCKSLPACMQNTKALYDNLHVHYTRFRFPNILLVYITINRLILNTLHVVGYTDEKALYCTSRNWVTSFEEGSPYCNIIGNSIWFIVHMEACICTLLIVYTCRILIRSQILKVL